MIIRYCITNCPFTLSGVLVVLLLVVGHICHVRRWCIMSLPPYPPWHALQEDYDPLEAFMAEINQEVQANKPTGNAKVEGKQACDEAQDPGGVHEGG